jgi:hypothetical protein
VLLTVEANRLMHLRKKGMLEKDATLQLDLLGEVIPVTAKLMPLGNSNFFQSFQFFFLSV